MATKGGSSRSTGSSRTPASRSGSRTGSTSARRRRRPTYTAPTVDVAPEVVRSIVGIVLMVLGAILLIGLALPGKGVLTDWIRDIVAPWFGTGRYLLPFLLLALGIYVERVGKGAGWGWTLLGVAIAFVGVLGTLAVVVDAGFLEGRSGGRVGSFISDTLGPLITQPGTLVVSLALVLIGTLIALNATLGSLIRPLWDAARTTGGVLLAPRPPDGGAQAAGRTTAAAAATADAKPARNGKAAKDAEDRQGTSIPVPAPAPAPVSSLFGPGPEAATAAAAGATAAGAAAVAVAAGAGAVDPRLLRGRRRRDRPRDRHRRRRRDRGRRCAPAARAAAVQAPTDDPARRPRGPQLGHGDGPPAQRRDHRAQAR